MAFLDDEAARLHTVRRGDFLWIAAVLVLALAARLAWYSGFGLTDDVLLRIDIANVLRDHRVPPGATGYRFSWWLPTAVICRFRGLTEAGLILPITLFATVGLGLVGILG